MISLGILWISFIDEYFSMRQTIRESISETDQAILSVFHANTPEEKMAAMDQYTRLVTAPMQLALDTAQPKADYYDGVIHKGKLISTTTIAKDLGLKSAQELNQIMKNNGVIYKKSKVWHPYSQYQFLTLDGYCDYQSYDDEKADPILKWTEKGRKWIVDHFKQWTIEEKTA